MWKIYFIMAIFFLLSPLRYSLAGEMMNVRVTGFKVSGKISNGTTIALVYLFCPAQHNAFQAWLDSPHSGLEPDIYELVGKFNKHHVIRVQIKKNNAHSDKEGGNGIIYNTEQYQSIFSVVAYGNQKIASDSYSIRMKGACLSISD